MATDVTAAGTDLHTIKLTAIERCKRYVRFVP